MEFAHVFATLVVMGFLYLAWERVIVPLRDAMRSHYVTNEPDAAASDDPPFTAFERAEPASFVQAERPVNGPIRPDELDRIDAAGIALAVGWAGEAAIIEALFAGVKRGGSARYVALRDAVRERATAHGWQAPPAAEERTITVTHGKQVRELTL